MTRRPTAAIGRAPRLVLGLGLLAASGFAACKADESLLQIDVVGDSSFAHMTLVVSANGSSTKTFKDVSLDPTTAFPIGLYLPGSVSGTVDVGATVDDGACLRGAGDVHVMGVASGQVSPPAKLAIGPIPCTPISDGGGAAVDGPRAGN